MRVFHFGRRHGVETFRYRLAADSAWQPTTSTQRRAVEDLTRKFRHKAYVRNLSDGSAEVVGVRGFSGFRYVVDRVGSATLVSVGSRRRRGLLAITLWLIGVLLIGTPILEEGRGFGGPGPWWPVAVGFVVLIVARSVSVHPRHFADRTGDWAEYGGGWDEGDAGD
jgi:hypothetical protein